ncbi:MAG: hypothetical protein ABIP75_14490 [Pyrinomonadaceae bacterium]
MNQISKILKMGLLAFALCLAFASTASAQEVVDKMVATVNSGVNTDLITYSDLLWQLALEPDVPLQNPSSENLNRALRAVIDQRLIAQEAEKLPSIAPTEKEIDDEIRELVRHFPANDFVQRLNLVGFANTADENFRRIIEKRVATKKYVDFRFRAFVVITPQDEKEYYADTYVIRFRKLYPNRIVPTFEQAEPEINRTLTETKIALDIDAFLESARERSEIVVLSQV